MTELRGGGLRMLLSGEVSLLGGVNFSGGQVRTLEDTLQPVNLYFILTFK